MNGKLLMVHIPKCAGITMNLIIGLDNPLYFGNKYGHHYSTHIKGELGVGYNKLTTFSVIRNPWDKLWSSYNFMKNGSKFMRATNSKIRGFEEFLYWIYNENKYLKSISKQNGDNLYFHKQKNWLFDRDGKQIVDIIGKFEDLTSLVNQLPIDGLSDKLKNTHSNQTKKVNYKEVYNDNMIDMVSEMYNEDIKLGDYEY